MHVTVQLCSTPVSSVQGDKKSRTVGGRVMPYKQLMFRGEAREKIVKGAASLADAVRVTLGPKSKCVLIGTKWGRPIVCNDGVTIAKEIRTQGS